MKIQDNDLAFAWHGLPQYAARCLQEVRASMGVRIPIIGTRATVPILGMDEILKGDVTWIDESVCLGWKELGLKVPKLFFVTGWAYPSLNHLADAVRHSGGQVVVMADNCWKGTWRQWMGAVYFRFFLRRKFAYALVPGASAMRLLRVLGMPAPKIKVGLYGADPTLFTAGPPLQERAKTIVYVGQYIERKGVLPFVAAFAEFVKTHPDWTFELYGSGPMKDAIPVHPNIRVSPFVQPQELAPILRRARALVLPSYDEHWGLVVHEAALSGCALLLSEKIGSKPDLGGVANCIVFKPGCFESMVAAMRDFASWDDAALRRAGDQSIQQATSFGPQRFVTAVLEITSEIGG